MTEKTAGRTRATNVDNLESRKDMAAMMAPLARSLTQAELPTLNAHGLTMWGYIVLQALSEVPMRSQSSLASAIGADKTRIISTLDALQGSSLIDRWPDPDDRRANLLALTTKGKRIRRAAQTGIQRREDQILSILSPSDKRAFLRALTALASLPEEQIVGDAAAAN